MSRNINKYQQEYMADYGFEQVMVKYRHKLVLERLDIYQPDTIIEIGCGSEMLYQHYLKQHSPIKQWIIIEPAKEFSAIARNAALPNSYVIQSFFENAEEQIINTLHKAAPDMIICSGLLHEVPNVEALLSQISAIMSRDTILHVNVPNANSMHRRLAMAMGLVKDTKQMSERNKSLLQHRVYDLKNLIEDLHQNRFEIETTGGYLLKPFTHRQMEEITSITDNKILDGLFELGRIDPNWASEIYVEAYYR